MCSVSPVQRMEGSECEPADLAQGLSSCPCAALTLRSKCIGPREEKWGSSLGPPCCTCFPSHWVNSANASCSQISTTLKEHVYIFRIYIFPVGSMHAYFRKKILSKDSL